MLVHAGTGERLRTLPATGQLSLAIPPWVGAVVTTRNQRITVNNCNFLSSYIQQQSVVVSHDGRLAFLAICHCTKSCF